MTDELDQTNINRLINWLKERDDDILSHAICYNILDENVLTHIKNNYKHVELNTPKNIVLLIQYKNLFNIQLVLKFLEQNRELHTEANLLLYIEQSLKSDNTDTLSYIVNNFENAKVLLSNNIVNMTNDHVFDSSDIIDWLVNNDVVASPKCSNFNVVLDSIELLPMTPTLEKFVHSILDENGIVGLFMYCALCYNYKLYFEYFCENDYVKKYRDSIKSYINSKSYYWNDNNLPNVMKTLREYGLELV